MKVKRILSLVLVLIMVAALFVGCGDKPDGQTTTTTDKVVTENPGNLNGVINEERKVTISNYAVNTETYEIGAKEDREVTFKGTIKIGNTAATTGAFAAVGVPFNQGLEAYINAINFNGGIDGDFAAGKKGYYIEFTHYDDNFDAATGSSYTKKLVEEDKVFALVGHFGSPTVGATIDYIKEKGVIACYFASGVGTLFNTEADAVENGSTLFPVQPIYTTEGRIIVARILEQYPDAKKIGVIFTSDEAGVGLRDGAKAQIEALGAGYECVLSETTSDAADFTPAVTKVADCDAIVIASIQKGVVSILKAMITNGVFKPAFTTYSVAAAQTLTDIKADYDTLAEENKFPIYANAWLSSTDVEAYLAFCEDIMAFSGSNETINNSYAMAGWISATIFCEGLERIVEAGKEITTLNFVEAMESEKIVLKMGSSSTGDSTLDYADGYRIGTTTMSLLKNNDACNAFEEAAGMKNFLDFMKSGDINDIK
ncbi:MAG: ABC transporter substrate-binding protein [Clostridia bacterium]|nr:ABC transporter substrate-binding protein [Clostridia bacterium]